MNDAAVAACVPQSIFGVDLRVDGYNPAAENYYNATITVSHENHQHDWMGYIAGDLWDFWGAGPIGLSIGGEHREERTSGIGRNTGTAGRFLFLNTGPDFERCTVGAPPAVAPDCRLSGYDTDEAFTEVNVPLFRDSILGNYAEFSAAYRYGDYSTVGGQEARSAQLQWRPVSDLLLRATWGESVRVPNLGENFGPQTQTFANGLVDPCDANALNLLVNLTVRANRIANCQALATAAGLPANFIWPGVGPTRSGSSRSAWPTPACTRRAVRA